MEISKRVCVCRVQCIGHFCEQGEQAEIIILDVT